MAAARTESAAGDAHDARLSVTVISGFLGSGKTTLLKHILTSSTHGRKVAVIVNDMAELNIDAEAVGAVVHAPEKLIAMQNGCICCTLREDLLREVAALARAGSFDYLIVESTGISEPVGVAETFELQLPGLAALRDVARLDTMVTVVDAANFGADMDALEGLRDRGWGRDEEDERPVSALLTDQVEFADVLILNKTDCATPDQAARVEAVLRSLNPRALLRVTTHARVPIDDVIGARRFSLEAARASPGWLQSLKGGAVPEKVVLIGLRADMKAILAAMEACLLTEGEFRAGPAAWGRLPNPIWGHLSAE